MLTKVTKLKIKSMFHVTSAKTAEQSNPVYINNENFWKPSKPKADERSFQHPTPKTAVISFCNVTWKNMKSLRLRTSVREEQRLPRTNCLSEIA